MKAIVISGGGSKGAFAGGIAEYMAESSQDNYDIFVGSSVGSLIISQMALHKIARLKKVFFQISNKDIFNIYPFVAKNKNGEIQLSIHHFNALKAFIKKSPTFGESKNLKKLIQKMLSKEEFEQIIKQKQLVITVSNITKNKVEYIEAKQVTYDDFCDWIWASSNVVPFMSIVQKQNNQYADGGFGTYLPVLKAIKMGATDIDAVLLNNCENTHEAIYTNPFQSLMGVFKFMASQIEIKDLLLGKIKGQQSQIDIRLWYPSKKLTNNPLYFDKHRMKEWWQSGYDLAKQNRPLCYCFTPDGNIIEK